MLDKNNVAMLQEDLAKNSKRLLEIRVLHANNQLKDTSEIRKVRYRIAYDLTLLHQLKRRGICV